MSKDSSNTNTSRLTIPTVPWQWWVGVPFLVAVFFEAQVLASILIIIPAALLGMSSHQSSGSVTIQFIFVLMAELISIGAVYGFLRGYRVSFATIGLNRPRLKYVAYGLAAVLPYYLLYALTVGVASSLVSGLDVNQEQQIGFKSVHGSVQLVMTFISLVVLPPLAEEIMVRGFLYSTLKKVLKMRYAVVLTSLIFAAAHLGEGGAAGPLYIAALDTFVLSLVLIYLREKTGSLWPCITLHAIKNGVAFVALFVLHVR